jgi:hypothetical protein
VGNLIYGDLQQRDNLTLKFPDFAQNQHLRATYSKVMDKRKRPVRHCISGSSNRAAPHGLTPNPSAISVLASKAAKKYNFNFPTNENFPTVNSL